VKDDSQEKLAEEVRQLLAGEKDPPLAGAGQLALEDQGFLKQLLDGLVSKNDVYRYNCFKVLLQLSQNQPLALVASWDYFVELLGSRNAYHRSVALQIIAHLTRVDDDGRFEEIFDAYFGLLDDQKVMIARHLAACAGRVAVSKPHLQERITERLLVIDQTHHTPGRMALIKGDAVQAFGEYFEDSAHQARILAFVTEQLESESPRTRKVAQVFLDRYGERGGIGQP